MVVGARRVVGEDAVAGCRDSGSDEDHGEDSQRQFGLGDDDGHGAALSLLTDLIEDLYTVAPSDNERRDGEALAGRTVGFDPAADREASLHGHLGSFGNQDDPVSEFNSKLWNSGIDSDKEQARKQKRRLKYVSNILVVKDSANPENEGKVFMYQFGKKIFDKLNDMMNPSFEDETPVNPFDFWEGANFRLKIRQFEGYPNYDKSEFDQPSAISEDDSRIEAVWNQQHSLQELVDPKNFKSYSELKAKLYRVLAIGEEPSEPTTAMDVDDDLDLSNMGNTQAAAPTPSAPAAAPAAPMSMDDDDDLSIFKELANG